MTRVACVRPLYSLSTASSNPHETHARAIFPEGSLLEGLCAVYQPKPDRNK